MPHPLAAPLAWVSLSALNGVGPVKGLALARAWLEQGGERPPRLSLERWAEACREGERRLQSCERAGVQPLSYACEGYPPLLRLIDSAPLVIYSRGAPPQLRPQLACVGTRSPSEWGLGCAREVAAAAAALGFGLCSGLALGIDAAAHEASLAAGGATWAVLGSGHQQLSPPRHRGLAERLIAEGGGLLSEYPPDAPLHPGQLVARDRLQSGLSLATFVVESDREGGALYAARAALRQGRALFIPVSPAERAAHPKHRGLRLLEAEGATRVASAQQLTSALQAQRASLEALELESAERLKRLWEPRQERLI